MAFDLNELINIADSNILLFKFFVKENGDTGQ